jgi:hypothetical protein
MLLFVLSISLFSFAFPIFFIGCTDPAMDELSQQGLLQDIPSAQEIRDSYKDQKEQGSQLQIPAPSQTSSTSGIDIPFLKGKSIDQVKGILTQQLGSLQEVLTLANPEEEIRRYENGEVSLYEGLIYRIKVIFPYAMRRSDALMYVGIPEQVDKYLVTHREYQLMNTFEMRRIRLRRDSQDNELVTEIEVFAWIPSEVVTK